MDIYGTLGPACNDLSVLTDMFRNGMTGIRLNLSHTTLKNAADMVSVYHKAAEVAGVSNAKLLIDMQGPELRIGDIEPVQLTDNIVFGNAGITVPDILFSYFDIGQKVLLDDGKILAEITAVDRKAKKADGRIKRGGLLRSRKSILLEGCRVPVPALTDHDRENLRAAKEYGVTGVMQPFVRSSGDLKAVRKAMAEAGCGDLSLMAKVENAEGMENLRSFFGYADEIVIARGDLGNSMPLWELPGAQKHIERECRKAHMPFMVVTQMLASMEENPVPTRAEVSDIYNAVLDGATSVMVTGETAVGKYPAEAIRYLAKTVMEALKERDNDGY